MIENVRSLDMTEVVIDSFAGLEEKFNEENKAQLFAGKTKTGEDITPSYLNDPYFKSRESAQRYSDWKDKITPNPKRKSGTPNLFINGAYYNTRKVTFNGEVINISSTEQNIESKYEGINGLGGEFKMEFIDQNLQPAFMVQIRKRIGL